jgi:predicted SnoaL-like aldol condensation-catalyzing enzyme
MSSAAQPISTPEQNKQLVLRWFDEVWNQGRRETIFELFPEGSHLYDGAAKLSGPDEFCRFYDGLRADFSDFRFSPIVSLAEGDLVGVHWSAEFRQTATGKPVKITGTSLVRVQNGVFTEAWQNWDAAGLASQLNGQAAASLF